MIVAVFDCVVYVQAALGKKGPAFACLALAEEKHFNLLVTPGIIEEVRRTLDQPALRRKYSRITDERASRFLERISRIAESMDNPPALYSLPRDPKDEPYLNLAIAAKAPFLVSRDNDLLDLMKSDEFRASFPDLVILDPVAFLRHVHIEIAKELGFE